MEKKINQEKRVVIVKFGSKTLSECMYLAIDQLAQKTAVAVKSN